MAADRFGGKGAAPDLWWFGMVALAQNCSMLRLGACGAWLLRLLASPVFLRSALSPAVGMVLAPLLSCPAVGQL
jgi:hypothetical protein